MSVSPKDRSPLMMFPNDYITPERRMFGMFPAYTTYMAVRKLPLTTTFLGFLEKFPN